MVEEISERRQFQQLLPCRRLVYRLVLQHPSEAVGDKDSVQAGAESRVDVRSRAVADHPRCRGLATVVCREGEVGLIMLLGKHLDGGKVSRKTGALQFAFLFRGVSLGNEDEAVPCGEICKRLSNLWEQLNLMMGNRIGEADDLLMLFVRYGGACKLLVAINQRAAKAL